MKCCCEIRTDSRNIESNRNEWNWIETDWNKSRWIEQTERTSKRKIVEWILIADFRKEWRNYWRRTNTVKIECKLRRTRNARNWMKWFTRKIQESCDCLLIGRFTDSSRWKSLLNHRMSDIVYHYRWNIVMKQMSLMKEYLKCVKQWPLRPSDICFNGILTWRYLKDIDEQIFVKETNTLMSFKCVKL